MKLVLALVLMFPLSLSYAADPPDASTSEGASKKSAPDEKPSMGLPLDAAVKMSLDRGCNYLVEHQNSDGSYGGFREVGVTALVVDALARSPRGYREDDGPFVSAAVEFLLAHQQPNGSIMDPGQGLENYKTSVSILALTGLDAGRNEPRYTAAVSAARDFVLSLQCSEESSPIGYDKDKNRSAYGGIGYGSDKKPDLSNTQTGLEALKAAGLAEDSDAYKLALVFLERCQNSKSNDFLSGTERSSTGDGGFIYYPGESKAGTIKNPDGTISFRSYGSMTYAGLKSYIYAGLSKDDPRVQAAMEWIRANFTVDENPGMATPLAPERGQMGLYYYYNVMARTFEVLGIKSFESKDGKQVKWARELATKLMSLQRADGSWVNPADRWWEGDPAVVTSYAVRALSIAKKHLD